MRELSRTFIPGAGIGALGGLAVTALMYWVTASNDPGNPGANLGPAVWGLLGIALLCLGVGFGCAALGTARHHHVAAFLSGLAGCVGVWTALALLIGQMDTDIGGLVVGASVFPGIPMLVGYLIGAVVFAARRRRLV